MSNSNITVRLHRDGTLHRVLADGTEEPVPPPEPIVPMTDDEIHAAALSDPDAQPLTAEQLDAMKPVPRVKTLRRALGLTQEEFAARFQIPVGTLLDWEQGRAEADQPARAYLKVIAADAVGVERALAASPPKPGQGEISDVFGLLKREGQPSLSIDEMNRIIEEGWAGER